MAIESEMGEREKEGGRERERERDGRRVRMREAHIVPGCRITRTTYHRPDAIIATIPRGRYSHHNLIQAW